MNEYIYNYELKLIDEVAKSKFSFKKVIKLLQLGSLSNRID